MIEGYNPPSNSKLKAIVSAVGLPWEGENKQARMLASLEHASDQQAAELADRVLEVLSAESGPYIRAIEGSSEEDERTFVRAVSDVRSTLLDRGLALDDRGRLVNGEPVPTADDAQPLTTEPPATQAAPRRDTVPSPSEGTSMPPQATNARKVFLVHGRDARITTAMTELLHAFDLRVVDWDEAIAAAGSGSPSTLEVIHAGMRIAHGVVVLFTADDVGRCKEEFQQPGDGSDETEFTGQARQNVMFEAGMAIGIDQSRTVLVHHGSVRWNSDLESVNYARIDESHQSRLSLGKRLRTAGLEVDLENGRFGTVGDFSPSSTATVTSDPTSQPEPPPALDADIATMLEWEYDPAQRGKLQMFVLQRTRELDKRINDIDLTAVDNDAAALLDWYSNLFQLSLPMLTLVQVGVSHDIQASNRDVWTSALQHMLRINRAAPKPDGQLIYRLPPERFSRARHLPAMLAFRTFGLTAVLANRDHPGPNQPLTELWMSLGKLTWRNPDGGRYGVWSHPMSALELLDEHLVLDATTIGAQTSVKFSMSRYVRSLLRPVFEQVCYDDQEWEKLNDQFEYRRALLYSHAHLPLPPMLASSETRWSTGGWEPENDFLHEVDLDDPDSPWASTDKGEPTLGKEHIETVRHESRRRMPI
ncbi:nucleotide-binding protein [Rhodococcus fascians]|nr:nucleotide-binding protein [Rhodococcus fascians]MBY4114865.1 nucleotide-binding protein [Rhodococcus fascians]